MRIHGDCRVRTACGCFGDRPLTGREQSPQPPWRPSPRKSDPSRSRRREFSFKSTIHRSIQYTGTPTGATAPGTPGVAPSSCHRTHRPTDRRCFPLSEAASEALGRCRRSNAGPRTSARSPLSVGGCFQDEGCSDPEHFRRKLDRLKCSIYLFFRSPCAKSLTRFC